MPTAHPRGEPESRAHRFRLSRRHLLAAGAAALVSSAIPISAFASPQAAPVDSPEAIETGGYPVDALLLDWAPVPPPSNIVSVPYRSQLDGSPEARANCGPASLAMLFSRYDDWTPIADIRRSVNRSMGIYWVDNGSTWEALKGAAESRGFQIVGLFGGDGKYRRWSVDDLVAQIDQENAVMILVRYRGLPGRESSYFTGNHYVVVVGVDPDGSIVYHDPAFVDATTGAYLTMSRQQLEGAWSTVTSGINYTGMAITPRRK